MGPAGTAVLRNMLVADVSDHADTVDVVPLPGGWQVVDGHNRGVDAGLGSVEVANTAWCVEADSTEGSEGNDAQKSGYCESFHLK